jgi:pimeloyl-ACP methyl ester carboxylesterase
LADGAPCRDVLIWACRHPGSWPQIVLTDVVACKEALETGVKNRPTVVSLHGIRTHGAWQDALSLHLTRSGFDYAPWKYGFFKAISLVNPLARQRQVEWILERYTRLTETTKGPISIIAHSFGTYVVAEAMIQYPSIKFDKIILCGSIVPCDYDWSKIIGDRGQASFVLNQYGRKDFWVRIAQWVIADAGPSGYRGFSDNANERVVQQRSRSFGHSRYFFLLNYRDNWIPFLRNGAVRMTPETAPLRRNWKFTSLIALMLIGLCLILYYGVTKRYAVVPYVTTTDGESAPPSWQTLESLGAEETELHSDFKNQVASALLGNEFDPESDVKAMSIQMSLAFSEDGRIDPERTGIGIRFYDIIDNPLGYFVGPAQGCQASGQRSANHVIVEFGGVCAVTIVGQIDGGEFKGRLVLDDGRILGRFEASESSAIYRRLAK